MKQGFVVIDGWATEAQCEAVRNTPREWISVNVPEGRKPVREGDGCGAYVYELAEAGADCAALYERSRQTAASVLDGPMGLSPFPDSAVMVKRYPARQGRQGWHLDTNGLTALLYLNTCQNGGETEVITPNGSFELVKPVQGRLLLMEGRKLWHRALPAGDTLKEILLFNLYVPGDTYRPPGTDALIRGEIAGLA